MPTFELGYPRCPSCAQLRAELASLRGQVEATENARAILAAERNEWHEAYNRLTGLLRKRFPANPDGSLPDWRVEDVMVENERLRGALKPFAEAAREHTLANDYADYHAAYDAYYTEAQDG